LLPSHSAEEEEQQNVGVREESCGKKSSGYASDADSDLESEDSDSDLESEDSDSDTEEVESPYNLSGLLTASRAVPEATKAQAEIAEL
jgi:hypothetical protein